MNQRKSRKRSGDQKESKNNNSKSISKRGTEVCYRCRKRGHSLRQCRENIEGLSKPTGGNSICFRCESTGHILKNCTKEAEFRNGVEYLPFAACFVCHSKGHLAGQCPSNENGLYPKGGGCRFCGSKRHFVQDCPEKKGDDIRGGLGSGTTVTTVPCNYNPDLLEDEIEQFTNRNRPSAAQLSDSTVPVNTADRPAVSKKSKKREIVF